MTTFFSEEHEYIRVEDGIGTIGITNFAQEALGDVVYVELPDVGTDLEQGDAAGVVESVKSASELYAPVSGEIVEVNEDLSNNPASVNQDPEGDAWFFKIKISDEDELKDMKSEAEYKDYIEGL